jgi:hypothetical protein
VYLSILCLTQVPLPPQEGATEPAIDSSKEVSSTAPPATTPAATEEKEKVKQPEKKAEEARFTDLEARFAALKKK